MITVSDFEEHALKTLNKQTADYYKSGANAEQTLAENIHAFQRIKIRPRFLNKDVSNRDLSTTFLGEKVPFPIGVSPTGISI